MGGGRSRRSPQFAVACRSLLCGSKIRGGRVSLARVVAPTTREEESDAHPEARACSGCPGRRGCARVSSGRRRHRGPAQRAGETASPGLWQLYDQTLSKARYIDLTHDDHAEHAGLEGLRPGDVQARGRPDHRQAVHVREGRLRGDGVRASRPTSSAPSSTRRRTGRPSTRASTSCRRPTRCGRWS